MDKKNNSSASSVRAFRGRAEKIVGQPALSEVKEKKQSPEQGRESFLDRLSRVSLVDKLFFTQHLGIMARAGISLSQALGSLAEQTPRARFKKILRHLQKNIEGGRTLSDSLANYPHVFSELFVSMIDVGETSGQLEEVLRTVTVQMKKDHTLLAKVRGALLYPIIVLLTMVVVGIAMIIFVIPKIVSVYEESATTLPLVTRVVISLSNFIGDYYFYLLLGLVLFVLFFWGAIKSRRGKYYYHALLLRLPLVGPIIKKINLARFNRILSSLLKTDILITRTFTIIATVLGNIVYRQAVNQAAEKLKKGVSVTNILKENPRLFPPVVIQIISVGEETGTLDEVSEKMASFYEEEVEQTMGNLATIIEPILMVILGAAVGVMAVAIVMPMYSLVNTV